MLRDVRFARRSGRGLLRGVAGLRLRLGGRLGGALARRARPRLRDARGAGETRAGRRWPRTRWLHRSIWGAATRRSCAAATRFGCRGLGLDIDDGALADAARAIEADGVGELVSVRRGDLNEFDLAGEIDQANAPVVVTCYLLPATLRELRPQLEDAVAAAQRSSCSDGTAASPGKGQRVGRDDRGFTVYCLQDGSGPTEPDSELLDLLGAHRGVGRRSVDAASLGCLNACAHGSLATKSYRARSARTRHIGGCARIRSSDATMANARAKHPQTGAGRRISGWIYVLGLGTGLGVQGWWRVPWLCWGTRGRL